MQGGYKKSFNFLLIYIKTFIKTLINIIYVISTLKSIAILIFIILAEYYFLSIFNLAYIDCILIIIISIYGASIIDLCYNMIDIKNILLKKIVGLL